MSLNSVWLDGNLRYKMGPGTLWWEEHPNKAWRWNQRWRLGPIMVRCTSASCLDHSPPPLEVGSTAATPYFYLPFLKQKAKPYSNPFASPRLAASTSICHGSHYTFTKIPYSPANKSQKTFILSPRFTKEPVKVNNLLGKLRIQVFSWNNMICERQLPLSA